MNRGEFICGLASGLLVPSVFSASDPSGVGEFHTFSKAFQFLKDPYKAADVIRRCGYDGVEWTVRPGGFVEPGNAVQGLRIVRDAALKAGLKAENIVVSFSRGDDPGAGELVRAAADVGFRSFRGELLLYDRKKSHRENLDGFRRAFDSLDALARKTGLKACYQNHATWDKSIPLFGSLVWDLLAVVKNYDPKHIGIQYDPKHIRAEGGHSWDHTLGAAAPWIDMVCLKNFYVIPDPKDPKCWRGKSVPANEGIVDFAEVGRLMDLEGVRRRFTVHYDYAHWKTEAEALKYASADLSCYKTQLKGKGMI